ncbi:MAG: tyrosine-type recombinase/integrase [Desulfosporosinus fructosivorans]
MNVDKITFTDFLKDWLNNVIVKQVENTTWESYKLVLEIHVIPYFMENGNLQLQKLQTIHIQKYYEYKLKEGRADGKGGLSANTVIKHHANIKKALDYATRMNLIQMNPANNIALPKKIKFTGKFYSAEQMEKLFKIVKGNPIESAVIITGHYGLRRGEILGLKWSAISFKDNTLTIDETRTRFSSEAKKKPKNESSMRTLPLMPKIKKYLLGLRKKQFQNKQEFGDEYIDANYVCCWDDGKPLDITFINHKFKEILGENEFPHIRFHDLRHSTASYLLKQGLSMKEVQVWLGHADMSTTANIYSHVDMEMKQNAALMINNLFDISKSRKKVSKTNEKVPISKPLVKREKIEKERLQNTL